MSALNKDEMEFQSEAIDFQASQSTALDAELNNDQVFKNKILPNMNCDDKFLTSREDSISCSVEEPANCTIITDKKNLSDGFISDISSEPFLDSEPDGTAESISAKSNKLSFKGNFDADGKSSVTTTAPKFKKTSEEDRNFELEICEEGIDPGSYLTSTKEVQCTEENIDMEMNNVDGVLAFDQEMSEDFEEDATEENDAEDEESSDEMKADEEIASDEKMGDETCEEPKDEEDVKDDNDNEVEEPNKEEKLVEDDKASRDDDEKEHTLEESNEEKNDNHEEKNVLEEMNPESKEIKSSVDEEIGEESSSKDIAEEKLKISAENSSDDEPIGNINKKPKEEAMIRDKVEDVVVSATEKSESSDRDEEPSAPTLGTDEPLSKSKLEATFEEKQSVSEDNLPLIEAQSSRAPRRKKKVKELTLANGPLKGNPKSNLLKGNPKSNLSREELCRKIQNCFVHLTRLTDAQCKEAKIASIGCSIQHPSFRRCYIRLSRLAQALNALSHSECFVRLNRLPSHMIPPASKKALENGIETKMADGKKKRVRADTSYSFRTKRKKTKRYTHD